MSMLGTEGMGLGQSRTDHGQVEHSSVMPELVFLPNLQAPEGSVITLVWGAAPWVLPMPAAVCSVVIAVCCRGSCVGGVEAGPQRPLPVFKCVHLGGGPAETLLRGGAQPSRGARWGLPARPRSGGLWSPSQQAGPGLQ